MATATKHLEREVKLEADLSFVVPDLGPFAREVVALPVQELRTAYFDTADLRLWQRGITLRHRTGEDEHGRWTLKLPSGTTGPTRDRRELSWSGERAMLPDEAAALVRGLVRRSTLECVAELSSARRRLALHDEHGAMVAEVDDDLVTVLSGPRDGRRFRQLEVELGLGGLPVLDGVLAALCGAGARRDDEAKLAKALRVPAAVAAEGRHAGRTRRAATARLGHTVAASIDDGLGRLLDRDYRLRAHAPDLDAEDVHQARVATRRLRSDLKSFGPVLDPLWVAHTRAELAWLGELLGKVRDADVLAALIADAFPGTARGNGLGELLARLQGEREHAGADLAAGLGTARYLNLLDRLHSAARRPPFVTTPAVRGGAAFDARMRAARALPALVRAPERKLQRAVGRMASWPSDEELHSVRIKAKQLRYAAEAAVPAVGRSAQRTAKAAAALQKILGAHHDAVGAEVWLTLAATEMSGAAGFAAGRSAAVLHGRQLELRREWRSAWRALERGKRRRWLTGSV